jgi:serine/threonine-protein kinase
MRRSMAGEGESRWLGPYLLLRTSGAGGMGRIDIALRAQPDGIPKLFVLKRMHAELRSPEQDARFRREAHIALQLSHGAIAETVGVQEIDGELVLLQELVHGVDLRLLATRLASANERMPVALAAHVTAEVARALAYAHAFGDLGIVHRDVTPDNVMLSFAGEVKLVDFGIARSDVDANLTTTGQIVGRPIYTAPEIWQGAQADRRADIYSLGVVLWQTLTGRPLGDDGDAPSGGARAAPPSAHNPDVSADLDAVVARALAPDPTHRYQTAGELQGALRPFCAADPHPGRALAELLARHFDVVRERRMLAADVERAMGALSAGGARELAAPATAPDNPRATTATPRVPRSRQPIVIVAGIVAAGLAIGIAAGRHGQPASDASAAAPPQAPPLGPTAVADEVASDATPLETAKTPARAHRFAINAGRARPLSGKPPRPLATPASVSADELLARAQARFDVGDTETALALAREAATGGAGAAAHVLMGNVLMSERAYDAAEREFAEAVRLDPTDVRAARLLALVREARSGRP